MATPGVLVLVGPTIGIPGVGELVAAASVVALVGAAIYVASQNEDIVSGAGEDDGSGAGAGSGSGATAPYNPDNPYDPDNPFGYGKLPGMRPGRNPAEWPYEYPAGWPAEGSVENAADGLLELEGEGLLNILDPDPTGDGSALHWDDYGMGGQMPGGHSNGPVAPVPMPDPSDGPIILTFGNVLRLDARSATLAIYNAATASFVIRELVRVR